MNNLYVQGVCTRTIILCQGGHTIHKVYIFNMYCVKRVRQLPICAFRGAYLV